MVEGKSFGIFVKWIILSYIICSNPSYGYSRHRNNINTPTCLTGSICSYVQKNEWGTSPANICDCRNVPCSLEWDPYDGRSLTHNLHQYKYCKEAPPPVSICHGSLPAYTSNHYYDEYGIKVAMKDKINCHCSNDEEYETKYEYYRKHNVYVVSISYFCKQLNICNANEYCRSRVGRTSKYLTDTSCKCHFNYQCPAIHEVEAETFILNGITIQGVKCRHR